MNEYTKSLPKYYELDGDIYVKVYLVGDQVKGINHWGNEYLPFNAVRNGVLVNREKFNQAVLNRKGQPILASAA